MRESRQQAGDPTITGPKSILLQTGTVSGRGVAGSRTELGTAAQLPVPSSLDALGGKDPLNTVGLALLAYGLVQLLSKTMDKLPIGRSGESRSGFTEEDRKRLDRTVEMVTADHQRVQIILDSVKEIHEQTRWIAEQRMRTDPRDGEPAWFCRGRGMSDQLDIQQRLIGQALDEIREANQRHDNVLRKLRAVWNRLGRRSQDGS